MQRVIEDTSIDRCVCGACKGSGLYIGADSAWGGDRNKIVTEECQACGGTGTCNEYLAKEVLMDLGKRKLIYPDYTDPNPKVEDWGI